jgi:RND family efflux transporter MFP subunit
MKRLLGTIAAVVFVGFFAFRLYQEWPASEAAAAGGPEFTFARTVGAARAEIGSVRQVATLVGSLRAEETVDVSPRGVNGRIVAVNVDLGDRVVAGDVLARLEDDEIQQQVQQSEASLEVSRSLVQQRELELRNQQAILDRAKGLAEQGLISAEELEQSQTRFDVARAQLSLVEAQLNQAQAGLRELRIRLDQTRIQAPISGSVGRRFVDPGAQVSSGTPIVTLVKLDSMELIANVPERDVVKLQVGTTGQVFVDALPGRVFEGRVARISPLLDPQTRTARVEIVIPNRDGALSAEMFARVELELAARLQTLRVPRAALAVKGDVTGVYLVDGDVARFQPIQTGLVQEDWVEITQGLQEGDTVVTLGANLLNDGDRIRVAGAAREEASG